MPKVKNKDKDAPWRGVIVVVIASVMMFCITHTRGNASEIKQKSFASPEEAFPLVVAAPV